MASGLARAATGGDPGHGRVLHGVRTQGTAVRRTRGERTARRPLDPAAALPEDRAGIARDVRDRDDPDARGTRDQRLDPARSQPQAEQSGGSMTARTLLAATFAVLGAFYAGSAVAQLAILLVLGYQSVGETLATIVPGLVIGAVFLLCRRLLADRLAPAAAGEPASPTTSQIQLVGI